MLESEECVAVDGGENPILLGLEIANFKLAVDNHGKCGGLDSADGEDLFGNLAILEGVEACGVHAKEPVADGTAEASFVEGLIVVLRFEVGEALADGFVSHGGNP